MTTLLATKLYQPFLPPGHVRRSHLIRRLNEGVTAGRQVTLVSAPAGYGKTTCVSEWVSGLDGWPVAWLSLESRDDDPGRFFTYLVAALQQVNAGLGREIGGVLRSGQLPPGEVITTTLINDILAWAGQLLLVLDDFQLIQDRFILEVLADLAANLPQPLYLVLLTREDPPLPLARLRANNQLTEIRAGDLRFTGSEADLFLNEVMGLSLSQADVALLEDKTEGWIAGLQLAGLSIHDRANASDWIASLSGSHRFVLGYLTDQVLDRQPEEIRRFLLQTAILDRLNGDLCDAVTGRTDGRAMLERLFRANLFVIALDDEGQWYRYHQLFADLIRDLEKVHHPEEIFELHRRAGRWYAQAGLASEAIQHALAAKDYALAVDLLESHAMDMIMQGYAKTVNTWLQALPAEWSVSSPRTHLACAWMHLLRGAYAQVSPYLERLQAAWADPQAICRREEKSALQAEWLVLRSLMLFRLGKVTESMAMTTQALELVPEQDDRVRSLACWVLASLYRLMDDYSHAVEAYQAAIQHGRAAENLVAEMMSTVGLAVMAFEHGQLHLAFEIASPVVTRLEQSDLLPPIGAVMYGPLADVCYQWVQIEQARHYARCARRLSALGGYKSGMINCPVLLSRISLLAGDLESATHQIQEAIDQLRIDTPDYIRQEAVAQQVRVYLARHQPAAAQMALQGQGFSFRERFSFPDLAPDRRITHAMGLLYNSSLRVLLYQARAGRDVSGLQCGIELAGRSIAGALQCEHMVVALEALLLRAQMHALLGDDRASQADYIHALELAEPEGFVGIFIEQGSLVAEALGGLAERNRLGAAGRGYVERILSAFASLLPPGMASSRQPAETGPAALVEPLTDRELDVLRLIAQGLKYKAIAGRLFISLNTVRFHVKAIYGKLNVNNRTQAVDRARRLQIL